MWGYVCLCVSFRVGIVVWVMFVYYYKRYNADIYKYGCFSMVKRVYRLTFARLCFTR